MSIISQGAVILLIFVTGIILRYAYIGLANAAEEGEHFVDEWAMRQQKKEQYRHRNPYYKKEHRMHDDFENDRLDYYDSKDFRLEEDDLEYYDSEELGSDYYETDNYETDNYETDNYDTQDYVSEDSDRDALESDDFRLRAFENNDIPKYTDREREPFRLHFPDKKTYRLVQFDEYKRKEKGYTIDHFPFKIGRESRNDIVLNDLSVAKMHCQIVEEHGQVILKDLNSANKIFADGEVVDEFILSDGQHFYVGGCEFMAEEILCGR